MARSAVVSSDHAGRSDSFVPLRAFLAVDIKTERAAMPTVLLHSPNIAGVVLTSPIPNLPPGIEVGDWSIGPAVFGVGVEGAISSAADVPKWDRIPRPGCYPRAA